MQLCQLCAKVPLMAPRRYWSKAHLRAMLVTLYEHHQRLPTVPMLRAAYQEDPNKFAEYGTFRRNYGSWENALADAGLSAENEDTNS